VPFLLIQVQDYLFIELIDEERIFQACYLPILLLLSSITSELTWFIKLYLTLQPEKMIQRPCPTAQNNLPPLLLSFPCSLILILFAPSLYLFASKTFPWDSWNGYWEFEYHLLIFELFNLDPPILYLYFLLLLSYRVQRPLPQYIFFWIFLCWPWQLLALNQFWVFFSWNLHFLWHIDHIHPGGSKSLSFTPESIDLSSLS
jgi:hypothetical protein